MECYNALLTVLVLMRMRTDAPDLRRYIYSPIVSEECFIFRFVSFIVQHGNFLRADEFWWSVGQKLCFGKQILSIWLRMFTVLG